MDNRKLLHEQYEKFIANKIEVFKSVGFEIEKEKLNENLFEFQKDIVRWALKKGRAAIFAGCGSGKTIMQLEWANQIIKKEGGECINTCAIVSDIPN